MDLQTLKQFFLWTTILNGGMLLFSSFVCMCWMDFAYKMNHRYFGISRDSFNTMAFSFIAFYKVVVLTFNVVPYLALLIVA